PGGDPSSDRRASRRPAQSPVRGILTEMWLRFMLYGLAGWSTEIVWTALHDAVTGTRRDPLRPGVRIPLPRSERLSLMGTTYLWMFPVYGLLAVAFEPAHDALRGRPWLLRGAIYAAGILAVEYAAGWLLRRLVGRCPWDYSHARLAVHG